MRFVAHFASLDRRVDALPRLLAASKISGTIGPLGRGFKMRLLIEAVVIVVIVYIAVRMFRKRG
jgi:hypothetical protein